MIGFTPYGESNINYIGMANCSLQSNDFTDMPGNGSERPTTHAQTCIINEAQSIIYLLLEVSERYLSTTLVSLIGTTDWS